MRSHTRGFAPVLPEAFTVGHGGLSRILVHAFTGYTVNTGMFAVDVRVNMIFFLKIRQNSKDAPKVFESA